MTTLSGLARGLALAVLSISVSTELWADDHASAERSQFVGELTDSLLGVGDGSPLRLGRTGGWRAVLLAPPGMPLASTMTPFDVLGHDTISVAKLLENASQFDSLLVVSNNLAHQSATPLSIVWERVLRGSMPTNAGATGFDPSIDPSTAILYKQVDEVDRIRGNQFLREPSAQLLRYREYDLLYRTLLSSEDRQDGAWRFHPRLSGFASVSDAKSGIQKDWINYGFKEEIDLAQRALGERLNSDQWLAWSRANADFENNRVPIDAFLSVPTTILFPGPSEWLGMASWVSGVSKVSGAPSVQIRYQVARIQIVRPWFDIDALLNGDLRLPKELAIRLGTVATNPAMGTNGATVYADELLLVRAIRYTHGDGATEAELSPNEMSALQAVTKHPLAVYANRSDINLLGYVVHSFGSSGEK